MWFPTNKRELVWMYGKMFVWKYGKACKIMAILLGNLFLFWWLVSSW